MHGPITAKMEGAVCVTLIMGRRGCITLVRWGIIVIEKGAAWEVLPWLEQSGGGCKGAAWGVAVICGVPRWL